MSALPSFKYPAPDNCKDDIKDNCRKNHECVIDPWFNIYVRGKLCAQCGAYQTEKKSADRCRQIFWACQQSQKFKKARQTPSPYELQRNFLTGSLSTCVPVSLFLPMRCSGAHFVHPAPFFGPLHVYAEPLVSCHPKIFRHFQPASRIVTAVAFASNTIVPNVIVDTSFTTIFRLPNSLCLGGTISAISKKLLLTCCWMIVSHTIHSGVCYTSPQSQQT